MEMKKISKGILMLYFLAIIPNSSFAYSKTGHQIITEIAMQYLDSNVKDNVIKYLNGTSIQESGIWMDEMRSSHEYDYMKPWHYINIEKDEMYAESEGENIINEIKKLVLEFNKKETLSNDQVKTDLLILFHLIGDLHQPLHVGYGDDKGGNKTQVNFIGNNTNLHKVWDDEIIQDQNITLSSCLQYGAIIPKIEMEEIRKFNLIKWLMESRSVLNEVYDFKDHKIDESYAVKMKPIIEKELFFAGIRLASILESYFQTASIAIENNSKVFTKDTIEISPKEAINHVGELVKVCGFVYGGKAFNKITLINMGAAYPDSPFTIAIFDTKSFKYKPEEYLNGKAICVIGVVKLYKDKAEIVASNESQIIIK